MIRNVPWAVIREQTSTIVAKQVSVNAWGPVWAVVWEGIAATIHDETNTMKVMPS